ncbi:DUF695 domain-containing protein [Malaciobacter mytili]|uniref:DUF695 domain-containing protein n=1 Tax=Malaciobacter mytili LMG 24559 TaxID=1032238 RepID=A0AAX2AEE3_9BACT|nr:DUF695 domain-containing protein [Malaciobacter mytili]AXH16250.1 DUF695 domain-containing protein [Malaciobacter mytili LMG 24559]RXI42380.1 hypothetical protein CRU99_09120 [Malaciobacter mytili]RXK13763.1 hypothetical protein CP985_12510 [Malaciobacter mytili LMG 24559]
MQNWQLKTTSNINQMLRVKKNINSTEKISNKNLVIVKHHFHIADDIMFPDPACLAFFTSFEQNHLKVLEEENRLLLVAVDIFEGEMKFYIYCNDAQKCIYDCISYLKSNPLYQASFEIYNQDEFKTYNKLLAI